MNRDIAKEIEKSLEKLNKKEKSEYKIKLKMPRTDYVNLTVYKAINEIKEDEEAIQNITEKYLLDISDEIPFELIEKYLAMQNAELRSRTLQKRVPY